MDRYLISEDMQEINWPDDAAVYRAACGDPAVFRQLYLTYIRPIYRYILSKVGEARQSEDLTAQVFLEALESLPRYRHDGHFTAWLFSIARHKVTDYYRSRHTVIPLTSATVEATKQCDPLSTIIQSEETQKISILFHQLDEQDRELLRLRFVAELSFGEIACLFHSNMEATKKRFYRLLTYLRQRMEADHD